MFKQDNFYQQYLLINNIIKNVIRNNKYKWIVGSDILLERDDIVQELMLRFIINDNLDADKPENYLYTFFVSRLLDIKRSYDRTNSFTRTEELVEYPFVDETPMREEVKEALFSLCVNQEELDLLVEHFILGYTEMEIADKLGIRRQSVNKKINRILKNNKEVLADLLEGIGGEVHVTIEGGD